MWNRKDLKAKGKAAFKKNYWPCVVVALVLTILTAGTVGATGGSSLSSATDQLSAQFDSLSSANATALFAAFAGGSILAIAIAVLIEIFVKNPIVVGSYRFFVRNSDGEKPGLGMIFSAYKDGRFGSIFCTMFLQDLFLILWSMLFVIPGIIKYYSYRMVPYLLADHPEMSATEIITESRRMMNGHKWNAFVLDLSFILWGILTAVTLGLVGVFYVGPYMQATNAELYKALKNN